MVETNDNLKAEYKEYGRLHGYGWLGILVILAFIAVGVVAYYGYTGPGLFSPESAIAGVAAGLLILTFAVLVVLFSLRSLLMTARNQAAQVAILRAQTYAHGLEMQHEQQPHDPTYVKEVVEPKFVENVVVNVDQRGAPARTPATTRTTAPRNPGSWACEELQGIGEKFGNRLGANGIRTIDDLRSARVSRIAQAADVNEFVAAHWKSMAELVMINGIGPQEAEVLALTGVHSPRVLAHHEPRTLFAACKYVVESRRNNIYPVGDIDVPLVRNWINAARVHVREGLRQSQATTTTAPPQRTVTG